MDYRWLRFYGWFNRFGTIRLVDKAFAGVAAGTKRTRRIFGFDMELDISRSHAQQLLYVEGDRFVEERHLLKSLLRPGMTAVDVGANIGYYLMLLKQQVGRDARVICIEPSGENLPELRRNIEINRFESVVLHEVALGDHEGDTGLHSGINSGIAETGGAEYVVPLRRLDQLVTERVDFLKVDVEGYEGQVLAGAEGILATSRPVLFLELHPHIVGRFGHSVRGILDSLARHYPEIKLYEKIPAASLSPWAKIATRYFGKDMLCRVVDPDDYVARYDRGDVSHTYWAVCRA